MSNETLDLRIQNIKAAIERETEGLTADELRVIHAAVATAPLDEGKGAITPLSIVLVASEEGCARGRQIHCAEREPNPLDWCVPCQSKYLLQGVPSAK